MLGLNGRLGCRKIAQKLSTRLQSNANATETQGIKIPPRIDRGPTDILKALASTVEKDPTASHYKYHDDPYFIPKSNMAKRSYALAKEAGRKAAIWIRQEHAELFQHRVADPVIQDFLPKAVYDENSKVSEKILHNAIKDARLSDALTIYGLLEKDGVSVESKQAILELLCYCSDQEPISEEFTEERWFRRSLQNVRPKWKSIDVLENLFLSLKLGDDATATAAYNAMICGTAKYLQVDRSWNLYLECVEKGLPVYTRTFNSVLRLVQFIKDSGDERKHLMFDILKSMAQQNVEPNIGTLNSCLQIATLLRTPQPARTVGLSVFKEMTNAGIKPSLGSYFYLLNIFCRSTGPKSEILVDIIDKLEGKEFEISDPQDLFFFVKAMDIAKNHLLNVGIAHRVHNLLLTGNNYNLIGENYMESIYYRHYLTLIVQTEPIDSFMALYDTLVPNIYIPEPDVMEEILQAIEIAGPVTAGELLPRIWSQMVTFGHTQRMPLLTRVLLIMHSICSPPPESPINKQYADIAWDIWTRIENQSPEKWGQRISWTGEMLGQVAILSLRGGYFDRMLPAVAYLTEKEGSYTGILSKEQVEIILEACIQNGHSAAAVNVVAYAANNGYSEAGQMGYKVVHSLSLNNVEETKLVNLVGKDILQLNLG